MSDDEGNAPDADPTPEQDAKQPDAAKSPANGKADAKGKVDAKASTTSNPGADLPTKPDLVEPRLTKDVTDNAANPRQAEQTNEGLRDAHEMFQRIGIENAGGADIAGDQVAGHKFVYQAAGVAATLAAYDIGDKRLDLARHAFVAPGNQAGLEEHCDRQRLTILHSPGGWGKNTVALRLLIDRHEQVLRYRTDVDFKDIAGSLEAGTGYLIEDLPDGRVGSLDPTVLIDLESKLKPKQARIIITIADSVTINPELGSCVVGLEGPPGHEDILRSHIGHYVGVTQLDTTLTPAIMELFQQEMKPGGACGRAADFARHLNDLFRRGPVEVDLLRARMNTAFSGEVEDWFTKLPDLPTKCLAIAMALFERLPYQAMVTAAQSLQDLLDPPPPEESLHWRQRPDPFEDGRSKRLRDLRARTATGSFPTPVGNLPAETAHYLDPAYPSEIINFVWREYDKALTDLLKWLYEMRGNSSLLVRIRAATVVGLISVTNFDQVRDEVIEGWATDIQARTRDMAAYALKEPGATRGLRKQVLALVDRWSRSDVAEKRATAARVYGSALGTGMVDRALRELGRLAKSTEPKVAFAIGYSLAELIEQDRGLARRIVDLVLDWISDRRGDRGATGELTFLTMAGDLIVPHRPDGNGAPGTEWPLLLALSVTDGPLRHALATAWVRTLNNASFHTSAQTVVGRWARLAEPDEEARDALAVLLATAAVGDPRTTRIVTGMATGWKSDSSPTHAPEAARAVLAALH